MTFVCFCSDMMHAPAHGSLYFGTPINTLYMCCFAVKVIPSLNWTMYQLMPTASAFQGYCALMQSFTPCKSNICSFCRISLLLNYAETIQVSRYIFIYNFQFQFTILSLNQPIFDSLLKTYIHFHKFYSFKQSI